MGEFPSVEERLQNSGIPSEMAAEIAAEVPSSRDVVPLWWIGPGALVLVSLPLAVILIPSVYLAAMYFWGSIQACTSGFWTSAHALALLQYFAAGQLAGLIQSAWLRQATHRTRARHVAATLLQEYSYGVGTGTMRPVIKRHPECATIDGYFRFLVWRSLRLHFWIWAILQTAVIAALFFMPLVCA